MITSTANANIKEVIQLLKKSRLRKETGTFVVEGIRMVREAPADKIVKIYASESFLAKNKEKLPARAEVVSDTVYQYMSDTKSPQGILAILRSVEHDLDSMLAADNPRLLVLDNLQDPGNLGTIFRTAEAAGINGIILSSDSVDIYNPKTIRSTMGAIYRQPFVYVEDLLTVLDEMKARGIVTYAAHLKGTLEYDQEDYTGACAFLIGNEGNGLSDEVSARAQRLIRIPMEGKAESLNAAVAAAILMYEAGRQRRRNASESE